MSSGRPEVMVLIMIERPATDDVVERFIAEIEVATLADGQIVEHRQCVVDRLVVAGESAFDLGGCSN